VDIQNRKWRPEDATSDRHFLIQLAPTVAPRTPYPGHCLIDFQKPLGHRTSDTVSLIPKPPGLRTSDTVSLIPKPPGLRTSHFGLRTSDFALRTSDVALRTRPYSFFLTTSPTLIVPPLTTFALMPLVLSALPSSEFTNFIASAPYLSTNFLQPV